MSRDRHAPATDPYFGVRLWLQTETRHGWVSAYNLEHLDLIERFVQPPLHGGSGMAGFVFRDVVLPTLAA